MANIVTTELITETLNGRSVLLSDKLSSDYTTMTEDQILNGTGVASMVSDIKKNNAFGDGASATTGGAIGNGATTTTGVAIGYNAHSQANSSSVDSQGGAAVGRNTTVTWGGAAVGSSASAVSGGAVGKSAAETGGGAAVGASARAFRGSAALGGSATAWEGGGAVGYGAETTHGGAVGNGAKVNAGAAIGYNAKCMSGNLLLDAIQLGTGTNATQYTMQVYTTQLLTPVTAGTAADGLVIPLALIKASYEAASTDDQNAFKAALGIS